MVQATRLAQLVEEITAGWLDGQAADALVALDEHPELRQRKSLAVELAYEEYCRRRELGEELRRSEFCDRFPNFRASLRRRLEVDEYLGEALPGRDNKSARQALKALRQDDLFVRFVLLEELGQGAIGRVFLAEELSPARQVVVKLSAVGLREADTQSKLDHPHIVPVFSADEDPESGITFLCMPYLGRLTLQDCLDAMLDAQQGLPTTVAELCTRLLAGEAAESPLDVAEIDPALHGGPFMDGVLRWGADLASALAHTHARGILHLDLKPSNVLLTRRLGAMLLDFNLSVAGEISPSALGGTLPFMAPEQIESLFFPDQAREIALDGRADLFSLGVLLYQLLSGKLPFDLGDRKLDSLAAAIELRRLHEAGAPSLAEANPAIDPEIAALIDQCLAVDRARRPASALELNARLEGLLDLTGRTARWARKQRRWFLGGALAGAAALVAGGAWVMSQEPRDVWLRREGWRLFQAGANREALDCFSQLVESDVTDHDAWFGRARCRQRLGDYSTVVDDLSRAKKLASVGKYFATLGYCIALTPSVATANQYFLQSIENGFESAELQNDIGYCSHRLGDYVATQVALNRALELNPNLPAAWGNRVRLYLDWSANPNPLDLSAAQDLVDRAIASDPSSADLAYDTACLLLRAAPPNDPPADRVLGLCETAIRLGCPRSRVERIPFLGPLAGDPRFRAILAIPESKYHYSFRMVDPLGDQVISETGAARKAGRL